MSVPTASRFSRYLAVTLRWLLIAFVVFVLTILGGIYITNNILQKIYVATAQVQVSPNVVEPAAGVVEQISPQTTFGIMQSPDFLLPVIRDLDLSKTWAKRVNNPNQDELPDQDALAHLNKILKIDFVRGTNIINITVSSQAPKEAADIANAIADRYKTVRNMADHQFGESPVRIISHALIPEMPSRPNKTFSLIVTIAMATVLSVIVASFNEVMLLLLRASERTGN